MPRKPAKKTARAAPGDGSISQRKDGLYVARLSLGTDENGKRLVWQKTSMEYATVEKALADQVKRKRQGQEIGTDEQTLAEFLDAWLESAIKPKAAKTYRSYKQIIEIHIKPALGKRKLCDLHPQHIQKLIDTMVCHDKEGKPTTRPASLRTRQYCRAILRSALGRAEKWRILDHNDARLVDVAKPPKRAATILTLADAQKVLEVIVGHPLEALYSVAIACGLRQSEALGLRWRDVNLTLGLLTIQVSLERVDGEWRLKDLKDHRRGKTVALPAFAREALRRRLEIQRNERIKAGFGWTNDLDLVFTTSVGTPLIARNVTRQWQMFLKRAGLSHLRFYDLRHTCASLLAAQGVPLEKIKDILGHSTIVLTADVYTHVLPTDRQGAEVMDSLFRSG